MSQCYLFSNPIVHDILVRTGNVECTIYQLKQLANHNVLSLIINAANKLNSIAHTNTTSNNHKHNNKSNKSFIKSAIPVTTFIGIGSNH